jgi:DNA-directed RNA polymerase subunit RPC12/RpoP
MKCPGQDSRYWEAGAIYEVKCPQCGQDVEFFKDESTRKCKKCGHKFVNPKMDFGCASYCKYAAQCLGDLPPELLAKRDDLLKDRVAIEVKKYFRQNFKQIGHAVKVARYAERIVKAEQGDPAVVIAAAYLHDIGAVEAKLKHGSADARFQEQEGPPIAREILGRLDARADLIEEVCGIVSRHHRPEEDETVNFRCLYDADLIANLEEAQKEQPLAEDELSRKIDESFLTESGRDVAREVLTAKRRDAVAKR